ncbi:MAG: hypothetical protein COZ37_04630 [bacterium (Candidatus Ratteibacteria) CG_4_10_14_3_um_filter_41_18]|uniref:Uncharacterized protein n=4 Tax=Candidatus Ratteibacteria TaxID=2979319 RepID=A0A2M7YHP6_9BACT|nr:MAG: hypothetical protein AUJ76_04475 [Candidatus Omnitrophica bacterium CG1_02_41_171]PIV64811.1 MAG: hypothetical protein COS11_00240 [bacterium (Candidatus Ratteibacteria) CG01_land_8_20_14_3_00_40_19]PIW31255.1 MAG: hypothetical protein COW28_07530 [bacterium (Candidatus Ratteibacteria) CG15_BIG_FIL_POST_REV_8_21_14_020_41_12]PIW74345.1 MAG: hypothetical protein CO004_01170 [bacterium (Candidatus Ratteibacteria) CG_4_8_14_3_um_filter_41_36]PIX77069.1 MAG: hypothetical protein COZ37_04630
MAKTNPVLKQTILEVVNNQLKSLDPPETKQTYDRLVADGISDQEARRLIGCVVSSEIFDVLKQQQPFDHDRFVKALNKLPKLPWE